VRHLPRLLVSSVVRGSRQGDSHGGLYLVDMASGGFEQVLDWNTCDINWEGRGADRGLRGIAFHGDRILVAASDELFQLDREFRITASWRNPYLKHCHEICIFDRHLYVTSTGFDSLLRFDLATQRFDSGIHIFPNGTALGARVFDPQAVGGPAPGITLHINNVHVDPSGIHFSGRQLNALVRLSSKGLTAIARLPQGTHNARPFRDGVLFNNTEADTLDYVTTLRHIAIPVPRHDSTSLSNTQMDETGLARQAFGRGLCILDETHAAAGSSPTTIAIYDLAGQYITHQLTLTRDVRNAAHGLARCPY
jgi:hypothetical protein